MRKTNGMVGSMFHQIEITTKCNYRCFYCAGRDMTQRHMSEPVFSGILENLSPGRHVVSLQGEGEPTAHPRFYDWAEVLAARGYVPYSITNGSLINPALARDHFPRLGFSLDTLDADEAERIGRRNLPRTLEKLEQLLWLMGPRRIDIYTVDYGQDLQPLKAFLRTRGLPRHIVQKLQHKPDYAYRYANFLPPLREAIRAGPPCRYLVQPRMRFFSVNGIEFPCSFIKNPEGYRGAHALRSDFLAGRVPSVCAGCAEIPTL